MRTKRQPLTSTTPQRLPHGGRFSFHLARPIMPPTPQGTPTGSLIHAVIQAQMPDGTAIRPSAKGDAILPQLGLEHLPMEMKLLMMSGVTHRMGKMREQEKRADGQLRT